MSDLHYHGCPECYEAVPCDDACSIERDLQDGDREFGGYCVCDRCVEHIKKREHLQETQGRALAARRA